MNSHPPDPIERAPSKSAAKREMTALQALGEQLVELPASQLQTLPLPENLLDAIDMARRIRSHEGRRRQMQLIGKLMRNIDPAPVRELLARLGDRQRGEALRHHAVEHWRDRMLADDVAITLFQQQFAQVDSARLQRLANEAREERRRQRAPKAARELFRLVKQTLDHSQTQDQPDNARPPQSRMPTQDPPA